MEGVGSRFGRVSSRYGSATVLSGPVRKWKKQWVHVPPSSSTVSTFRSNNGNGNGNGNSAASALRLRRWTPISTTSQASDSDKPEEPPRRKCRYTPIVILEERKGVAAEKFDEKAKPGENQSLNAETSSKSDHEKEKSNTEGVLMEEIQAADWNLLNRQHSNLVQLNLNLDLEGYADNDESDSEEEAIELVNVKSGFWT